MTMTYDVCVVGGGIIGLCSAIALQSRGQQVAIFERAKICGGASFGNAGHLATEQVFPIADPSILKQLPSMLFDPLGPLRLEWAYLPKLMPWAIRLLLNMREAPFLEIHNALKQINSISLIAWQKFADTWGLNDWVKVQGSLLTAESISSLETLKKHAQKLSALGISAEFINQNQLLEQEPALSDNQLGAVFFPQTGHVTDLAKVAKTLVQHFVAIGGMVFENCRVLGIDELSEHVRLSAERGEFFGKNVLIATGAFSKSLVKKLTGVAVPLDTERGYHLMLPYEANRLSIPVTSSDRRFIMTPMVDGLRLAGTVEYAGLSAPPNMNRAYNLLALARPMFKDGLNESDTSVWMGFRPSTADSLPVIDKVGRILLNFGHQHLGLTQAVTSSDLITALYFNESPIISTKPYRLDRF